MDKYLFVQETAGFPTDPPVRVTVPATSPLNALLWWTSRLAAYYQPTGEVVRFPIGPPEPIVPIVCFTHAEVRYRNITWVLVGVVE